MRAALAHRTPPDHGGRAAVLCIDDDPVVQIMLAEVVRTAGAYYVQAQTAAEAEALVVRDQFDLILLDRRLPDSDGLLLIRTIRNNCDTPVIVLSELGETRDRLLGIGLGAAEYMIKPFSPAELSSRIRYMLLEQARRKEVEGTRQVRDGRLTLLPQSRQMVIEGEGTFLPPAEARLLGVFLDHVEQVLSRDDLTLWVCGRDWSPGDRTVDVLIARLRRKIPESIARIVTIHRTGYMFSLE